MPDIRVFFNFSSHRGFTFLGGNDPSRENVTILQMLQQFSVRKENDFFFKINLD